MDSKKITRRSFLKKGAIAAGALSLGTGPQLLLPRKGQAAADKGPIVFCTYGGPYGENMQKYVIDPFVKKTGIEVIRTSTPNFAKVKAMVEMGNVEWDVVDSETRLFYRGSKEGMFNPLDWSVIGRKDELVPGGAEPMGAANVFYCGVLCWNKNTISQDQAPKNWGASFNLPGKRTFRSEAWGTLEIALMADGVPVDKLYPLDVERALKKLSTIKKDIIFWKKTKMALDLFTSGEVDFGYMGYGPTRKAIESGLPLKFTWEQAILNRDYLVIPKGSKQVEASMKFIAHCMDPEIQAQYSMHYHIGPSNTKAFDFITKERAESLPTAPAHLAAAMQTNGKYWADNHAQLAKQFDRWLMS